MAVIVLGVVALSLVAATISLLIAILWPRLSAGAANWFAFPALAITPDGTPRPDPVTLTDQAWQQIRTLARIALRKHRLFRIALVSGSAALLVLVAAVGVAIV